MKKIIGAFVASVIAFSLAAITPEEVLKKARTQTTITSMASDAEVNIQRPVGTTIESLKLRQYTGKDANGLQSSMIIFMGPAKHKNTRFLMIERADGSTDQRVYLPSMGKSRRVAAGSDESAAFFGTDFSYGDISFLTRSTDLDTHTFLPDETYNGEECYVIESVPKNSKETYSKSVSKIAKSNNRTLCAEFFDKKGNASKFLEFKNYKNIDGVDTPMDVTMTTYATGTATVISIKKIQYGLKVPAAIFTTRYLETGK